MFSKHLKLPDILKEVVCVTGVPGLNYLLQLFLFWCVFFSTVTTYFSIFDWLNLAKTGLFARLKIT